MPLPFPFPFPLPFPLPGWGSVVLEVLVGAGFSEVPVGADASVGPLDSVGFSPAPVLVGLSVPLASIHRSVALVMVG